MKGQEREGLMECESPCRRDGIQTRGLAWSWWGGVAVFCVNQLSYNNVALYSYGLELAKKDVCTQFGRSQRSSSWYSESHVVRCH